jgi:site-specific DNA-cytosine methylase
VLEVIDDNWDMMIAHPPCTHLSVSGARYWKEKQADGRQQAAIVFFMQLVNANINKIAIENPVGIMSTYYRKPSQYIQPYEHGHKISKKTGLWLKNLPNLLPTEIVEPEWVYYNGKMGGKCSPDHYNSAFSKDRGKVRSKTYQGIADAMSEQWG